MTTVTKTHHRKSYAAIAPQANPLHGRITLITGGGSGIGFAIASSAVAAKADRVIICGRREETLDEAVSKLTAMVPAGASTQISRYKADITSQASIDDMWKQLKQDKIEVNTLILNAAKLQYPSWDSDDAVEAVWNVFEGNVHACLRMTKAFTSQGPEHGKANVRVTTADGPQILLNISSAAAHMVVGIPVLAAYGSSKAAAASFLQTLAAQFEEKKLRIINIHPGSVMTEGVKDTAAIDQDRARDDPSLPGDYCVWASTEKAAFLHGRFVWAAWDVEELAAKTDKFKDPGYLHIGVQGVATFTLEEYTAQARKLWDAEHSA